MAGDSKKLQPIIIKRVRKGGHAKHGGAWKIAYADFVTVMHAGKVLAEGSVAEIQADPKVQEVYLGTVTEVALDG